MKRAPLALALLLVPLLACDFASVVPSLAGGLSRLSIDRVRECSKLPERKDRAKCIGAHAGGVALDAALKTAAGLAEQAIAANAPTGSESELSAREEKKLRRDLNRAMIQLEEEVAAAQ